MPPLSSGLLVPLTVRFRKALARIDAQATPALEKLWASLPAYDEENIADFERRAQRTLTATKSLTVAQAVGYYSLTAGVRPPPVKPDDVPVEPDTRGPFIQTWSALKHGDTYDGAVLAGTARAAAMVTNYISSTSRQTGDVVFKHYDIDVGWTRDPEPNACDWCLDKATVTYTSAEATDFGHDRCSCIGVPAF